MKSVCISFACLFLAATAFCKNPEDPMMGNVVYLGGERNRAPAEWIGKNVSDVLPTNQIQKVVILPSPMSSMPPALNEVILARLWTQPVKVIAVGNSPPDGKAWFDAVVVLKSSQYVRVTFWNEFGRFVTANGIGFFKQKEIYVQPKDSLRKK